MKATLTKVRSKGNIDSDDTFEMSFDEKNRAKLSKVFIDIYEDLETAIIREYAANALDAHIAVGQTQPIRITLPTVENNAFIIEDSGIGMSLDGIKNYYAKYGASTKDEDNDTIGSFGLGCKAALAIVPSFTVSTSQNGVTTVVIISREQDSLGKVQKVFHGETGASDGTKVTICITEKFQQFKDKVYKVFRTWPAGSVLINGQEPVDTIHNTEKYFNFGNVLYIDPSSSDAGGNSYTLNMGGIGYPVKVDQMRAIHTNMKDSKLREFNILNYNVVINVPMGEVDLISNRESVRWTKRSLETASAAMEEGIRHAFSKTQAILDNAYTVENIYSDETLNLMYKMPALFDKAILTWKGEELPSDRSFENLLWNGMDTSHGNITETGCVIYSDGRQQKRYFYPNYFQFGFSKNSKFKKFMSGEESQTNNSWVFVDLRNEENRKYSSVASTVRTFMRHKEYRNVQVVYVLDETIYSSPWVRAIIKLKPNVSSFTLSEMKEYIVTRRKVTAKTSSSENREVRYNLYWNDTLKKVVAPETGRKGFTVSDIKEMVKNNPDVSLYADNILLVDKNSSNHYYYKSYLPDNALIVLLDGAKTVGALEKKLKLSVLTNLGEMIGAEVAKKLETFDFIDIFRAMAITYNIERISRNINLQKKGFLQEALSLPATSDIKNISHQMAMLKDIEGVVIPETASMQKIEEIKNELPLFFENNWNTSARKANYWAHMVTYIESASDTVDKIVSRKG